MAITRHAERRTVAFAPRLLFDLVADVPRYPEFLPWCTAARVRRREAPDIEIDELAIRFGPFHERFVSRVVISRDNPALLSIETSGIEGPFRHLTSRWIFRPHGDGGGATDIDFVLEFEFRSRLLQHTVRLLFAEAVRRMVSAFEARAAKLYARV